MATLSSPAKKPCPEHISTTLPLDIWKQITAFLSFADQDCISTSCRELCKAACPYYVVVSPDTQNGVQAQQPWRKSTLAQALASFGRFRRRHPRRLFQIRLCPGVHETGFVDYDGAPYVIGPGNYTGLSQLKNYHDLFCPRDWDGLHIRSTEFTAVCGTYGVESMTLRGIRTIEARSFMGCTDLVSVTLPEGLQSIGIQAFSGCIRLRYTFFPESLRSVGVHAFEKCTSLESVTLPRGVQQIGQYTFWHCRSLHSVHLGDVQKIEPYAFYGCTSLASITLPQGLQQIGDSAFADCSLTSVTLPQSLREVGRSAFIRCTKLAHVSLRERPQKVGMWAFYGCNRLTRVSLPRALKPFVDAHPALSMCKYTFV